jgi:hypothetical protein
MFVNYLQKPQLQSKYPPDFKEEILVGFTLVNGDILTTLLKLDPTYPSKDQFMNASLVAQNLYRQNIDIKNKQTLDQESKAVSGLYFDISNDLLMIGNSMGVVKSISRVLSSIIKGNTLGPKTIRYEDPKQLPFFSYKSYKKIINELPSLEKEPLRLFSLKANKSESFVVSPTPKK